MPRSPGTVLAALLALLALAAAACGDASGNGTEGAGGGAGGLDRLDGEWRLMTGTGPEGDVVLGDGVEVTLEIDGGSWGGEVCNHYSAGEVSVGDGTVAIREVIHTEMACVDEAVMEAEAAYLAAFLEVDAWEIADDRLTLTGPDTELVFERVQPTAEAATGPDEGPS